MADTTTRHYILGVIMMMFFVVGGVSLLSEYRTADATFDATDRTGEFNRSFNQLEAVQTQINTIESNFESDPEWGVFGALNALIKSAWNTFSLIFTSWGFMDSVFDGMYQMFGIPSWVSVFIGMIITVIIAFAIYSLIFQKDA